MSAPAKIRVKCYRLAVRPEKHRARSVSVPFLAGMNGEITDG
jgi:hypothetical protein